MPDRDCVYQNCSGVSNGQKMLVMLNATAFFCAAFFALTIGLIVPGPVSAQAVNETPSVSDSGPSSVTRGPSGLPIPRFVSLGSSKVNMRTGPGQRYPIDWVYKRRGLPLEVIGEYDLWRQVRDIDGDEGWMHKQLLTGRRTGLVTATSALLHDKADAASPPVLRAEQGVQGHIDRCEADWCRMEVDGTRGWVQKDALWGVYPAEVFR